MDFQECPTVRYTLCSYMCISYFIIISHICMFNIIIAAIQAPNTAYISPVIHIYILLLPMSCKIVPSCFLRPSNNQSINHATIIVHNDKSY